VCSVIVAPSYMGLAECFCNPCFPPHRMHAMPQAPSQIVGFRGGQRDGFWMRGHAFGCHAAAPYVFTTTGTTSISGFSRAKQKLDDLMGIVTDPAADGYDPAKQWRVHDLRRTITSTLAELGVSTDVADRLLNHVSGSRSGVKGVHQRYEFLSERKRAIETWGKHVQRLVSDTTGDNVVSLRASWFSPC
jgi:hypothetical protein